MMKEMRATGEANTALSGDTQFAHSEDFAKGLKDQPGDNESRHHNIARSLLRSHLNGAHIHYAAGWSSAFYTALLACDVAPGDEVILPALAPAGIAQAILLAKAKPVFVDVNADSLLIDHAAVLAAITERTRGVVLCHLYGQISQHEALYAHLGERSIALIEDGSDAFLAMGQIDLPAAHCDLLVGCLPGWRDIEGELPAFLVTRKQAVHARMSYWTAQHDIAERLFQETWPDVEEAPYVDLVGELTEQQDQYFQNEVLIHLDARSVMEKQIAIYDQFLPDLGIKTLKTSPNSVRILQSYPICLERFQKAALFDALYKEGFAIHQTYRNLTRLQFFSTQESVGIFTNAENWSLGAISLPTGSHVAGREQKRLIHTIANFLRERR